MILYEELTKIGVEVEATLKRFMGANTLYKKFLRAFPNNPQLAELQVAIGTIADENPDFAKIEYLAHSLKGNCANLGMTKLAEILYKIEKQSKNKSTEYIFEYSEDFIYELDKVKKVILTHMKNKEE